MFISTITRLDRRQITLLGILLLAAGCARPYSKIEPKVSRADTFSAFSCAQMQEQQTHITDRLAQLAERQKKAVAQDVASFLILGFPTSGGGKNKDIAAVKGQEVSLAQAMAESNCPSALPVEEQHSPAPA